MGSKTICTKCGIKRMRRRKDVIKQGDKPYVCRFCDPPQKIKK